jgi:hypothetical protein
MRRVLTLLVFALLAGCGQPADLGPLLVQDGDLPPGLIAGALSTQTLPIFAPAPAPAGFVRQDFTSNGAEAGGVAVLRYEQDAERARAYEALRAEMGSPMTSSNVAQQADIDYSAGAGLETWTLLFQRCTSVVHIRMVAPALTIADLESYAQRLDARLRPVIC